MAPLAPATDPEPWSPAAADEPAESSAAAARAGAADARAVASTARCADAARDRPARAGLRRGRRRARAASTASPAACGSGSARPGSSTRCSTSRAILGLALGAGLAGLLPVPEIQYLAYLHNAADQLRGEAATLQFFSQRPATATRWWCGSPATPTRRASAATSTTTTRVAALRDIPGLVVASPVAARRRRRDAAHLRGRGRGRRQRLRVPRADRALPRAGPARAGRRRLAGAVPGRRRGARADRRRAAARRRRRPDHRDLRQRAADEPAGGPDGWPATASHARVVDLRWLRAAAGRRPAARGRGATGRVLVVDETRRSGGVVGGRARRPGRRRVRRAGSPGSPARTASSRSARAADLVLLDQETVEAAALALLG